MSEDKFKSSHEGGYNNNSRGSYNIRWCEYCGKYQHFKRCYRNDGRYRDKCSACGGYYKDMV